MLGLYIPNRRDQALTRQAMQNNGGSVTLRQVADHDYTMAFRVRTLGVVPSAEGETDPQLREIIDLMIEAVLQ